MRIRKIVSKQYHPVVTHPEKPVFTGVFKDCTLFPLDAGGGFGGYVQHDAAGVGDLVDDALAKVHENIIALTKLLSKGFTILKYKEDQNEKKEN